VSIKLIDAVWSLKLDNEGELLVLLALADNANDEGAHCFPSQRRIAWKTDLTVKSVSAIIARLEKKGLVETLNKGNQHRPTNYALHLEKGIQKEAFIASPWAGDKVESTPTEVQVNSVKAEVHVGGSEMHAKESELHLHDSELHVDASKTNLNCGQQTTSTTQPPGYPSGETHDPAKTAAAAPDAPGASAKAVEKAAGKDDKKEHPFPVPLPHWMTSTRGNVPGVVFQVPKLRKFEDAHPRAIFRIGDVQAKVWGNSAIAKLEAAEGKLLVVIGRWEKFKGRSEFVVTAVARQSAEEIAADIRREKSDSPKTEPARIPMDENHPDVKRHIEYWEKHGMSPMRIAAVVREHEKELTPDLREAVRIYVARMPSAPAPIVPSYPPCNPEDVPF